MKLLIAVVVLMLIATAALAQTVTPKITSANPLPMMSADRLTVVVGPSYDWNLITASRGESPNYNKDWTLQGQLKYQLTDGTNSYIPGQKVFLFSSVAYTARDRLRKPLAGNLGLGLELWGSKPAKQ